MPYCILKDFRETKLKKLLSFFGEYLKDAEFVKRLYYYLEPQAYKYLYNEILEDSVKEKINLPTKRDYVVYSNRIKLGYSELINKLQNIQDVYLLYKENKKPSEIFGVKENDIKYIFENKMPDENLSRKLKYIKIMQFIKSLNYTDEEFKNMMFRLKSTASKNQQDLLRIYFDNNLNEISNEATKNLNLINPTSKSRILDYLLTLINSLDKKNSIRFQRANFVFRNIEIHKIKPTLKNASDRKIKEREFDFLEKLNIRMDDPVFIERLQYIIEPKIYFAFKLRNIDKLSLDEIRKIFVEKFGVDGGYVVKNCNNLVAKKIKEINKFYFDLLCDEKVCDRKYKELIMAGDYLYKGKSNPLIMFNKGLIEKSDEIISLAEKTLSDEEFDLFISHYVDNYTATDIHSKGDYKSTKTLRAEISNISIKTTAARNKVFKKYCEMKNVKIKKAK